MSPIIIIELFLPLILSVFTSHTLIIIVSLVCIELFITILPSFVSFGTGDLTQDLALGKQTRCH